MVTDPGEEVSNEVIPPHPGRQAQENRSFSNKIETHTHAPLAGKRGGVLETVMDGARPPLKGGKVTDPCTTYIRRSDEYSYGTSRKKERRTRHAPNGQLKTGILQNNHVSLRILSLLL